VSLQERVKALQRKTTPYDIEAVASGRIRLISSGEKWMVIAE
jgi:hypothetical protein